MSADVLFPPTFVRAVCGLYKELYLISGGNSALQIFSYVLRTDVAIS